jgi:N-acetylglutamate synthase-like GNAT family acetyltransferase
MQIQSAIASEISGLDDFYRLTEYGGPIAPEDLVVYAIEEGRIIGAGRLSEQEGVFVLRGMRVLEKHRGRGVGKVILGSLVKEGGGRDCYCIPYSNLQEYYTAKGFHKITPSKAPGFLRDRFKNYRSRGLDVILMRRKDCEDSNKHGCGK